MAIIRASCPACGDVEMSSGDVRVLVCSATRTSSFAFQCPSCRAAVVKPADERVVDLLLSSGISVTVRDRPDEIDEVKSGLPITHDDLLDFHFQLGGGASLDAMLAGFVLHRVGEHRAPGAGASATGAEEPTGPADGLRGNTRRMARP